jgi:hypothetical protein
MSNTNLKLLYHPTLFFNGNTAPQSDPGAFSSFLSLLDIPYTLKRYNPKKDKDGVLLTDWTFSSGENSPICLTKIKSTLQNIINTNIKVLLWQPYECFSWHCPYYAIKWRQNIHLLQEIGFPPERIFFVTGDILSKPADNAVYNSINVIGIDTFPFVTATRYTIEKRSILPTNKTKKFLCLNALPRDHRCALYYYANKYNLLDDSLFSWTENYIHDNKQYNFDQEVTPIVTDLPKIILQDDKGPNKGYQNLSWYDDTVFSLVTETSVENNLLFLTEKIYKPIMIGHPFVVWGNPGTLEYLRKQGYETFPELFDESYDKEKNKAERLKKIIDLCKNTPVKSWSQETIEKIEHNKQHFDKQWKINFAKINTNIVKSLLSLPNDKNQTK